jgi:Leucine-rich repeat (LRR) protein
MGRNLYLKGLNLILVIALLLPSLGSGLPSKAAEAAVFDCSTATGLPQAECEALVALYNATGGTGWVNQTGWLQTTTPCQWFGVTCHMERIIYLQLSNQGLTGAVPSQIGSLSELRWLHLFWNQITSLPPEIGQLTKLEQLYVYKNQLTSLPPEIGSLIGLTYLPLSYNQLSTLPAELFDLPHLQNLQLDHNRFETLSAALGNAANLISIRLEDNYLRALPNEIGYLTKLKSLNLENNYLVSLPDALWTLPELETLNLANNWISSLPPAIGNLPRLSSLDLSYNRLTAVPSTIGSLGWLSGLNLGGNQLTTLPAELWNLTVMSSLNLSGNPLGSLPPQVGNMSQLYILGMSETRLSSLPAELWTLTNLSSLSLYGNQLTTLPADVGNLSNLWSLNVSNNLLTSLPPQIGDLYWLRYLGASNNLLTSLPPQVGNLASLWSLSVGGNNLTSLPAEIANMESMWELSVANNPLSGELPTWLTFLQLDSFSYYDTQYCAPASGPTATWLGALAWHEGTGYVCGQPTGALSGKVTRPDSSPLGGIQATLYRPLGSFWHIVASTVTAHDGAYSFGNLGQGIGYRMAFVDPSGVYAPQVYSGQGWLSDTTPVTITLGSTRTGINASMMLPAAPVAEVTIHSGMALADPRDGKFALFEPITTPSPVIVRQEAVCPGGAAPNSVSLVRSSPEEIFPMSLVGPNLYQGWIDGEEVVAGAQVWVRTECESFTTQVEIGNLYFYHPTGKVTDAATKKPLTQGLVTLYHVPGWLPKTGPLDNRPNTCQSNASKAPTAPWNQPAPDSLGVVVYPESASFAPGGINQQPLSEDGEYSWNLGYGCWYVVVEVEGQRPYTSPVVGGPGITKLNVAIGVPGNEIFLPLLSRP